MRGEYDPLTTTEDLTKELPPHARRIPFPGFLHGLPVGTTSACAENTRRCRHDPALSRNYLRMRGEYPALSLTPTSKQELPPHARRILDTKIDPTNLGGTTSACAENTLLSISHRGRAWNYLRMRGEYPTTLAAALKEAELPPHARRIQDAKIAQAEAKGTTSACAENTLTFSWACASRRNYLRMRGEYRKLKYDLTQAMELPPHARRIPTHVTRLTSVVGTTSACAENTA